MLTADALRALIADHESDRVELTVSTTNTDKFGEAICAFANDFPNHRQPGYLVVGVEDDGTVRGGTVTDALLRNLGALRSNVNIEPLPAMTVQKHALPEGEVAVVEVLPSDLPPVRYLPMSGPSDLSATGAGALRTRGWWGVRSVMGSRALPGSAGTRRSISGGTRRGMRSTS